ncbi:hypothetical protein Hanom_Chr17g01551241 [Helianthus anomalus]
MLTYKFIVHKTSSSSCIVILLEKSRSKVAINKQVRQAQTRNESAKTSALNSTDGA